MSDENNKVAGDALDATLKNLLDSVEKTDLNKGGVENSGTHGSGGKQGGGQGSESDAGPIDNMMIAKMIQAGVDVKTAGQFADFMAAKMRGDGDDDEDDEDYGKSSAALGKEFAEQLTKSFREHLSENLDSEADTMVDITPYLDGLTTTVGEQLEGLNKALAASHASQDKINKALARAVHQMGSLVKSQAKVIDALGHKLGILEKAPVQPPKGKTGTATPMEKSMAGEAGGGGFENLTKSQVLSALSYANLVKGQRDINGQRTSDVITNLEAGGVYDERTHAHLQGFLKSLSAEERQEALTF